MMPVLGCLLTLCIAACPAGNLQFVGDSRNFKVDQNCKNEKSVPSVEGIKNPTDFYNYYSASSHTGFEVPGRSFVFLYRNLNEPEKLSIFWLHGFDGNEQGAAKVHARISGIPSGVSIAQADDSKSEFGWSNTLDWDVNHPTGGNPPASPYIAGRWYFKSNTDGGALDGLPMDQTWELKLEIKFVSGMNDWRFFFADGSDMVLNTSEPLYVRSTKPTSSVEPYPEAHSTHTYCTLAHDITTTNLTYTFSWGDGFPDVTVSKAHNEVACAEHVFCHPEFGCFGDTPRNVTVTVTNECGETITKTFASELTIPSQEDYNPRCAPPPTDVPDTPMPIPPTETPPVPPVTPLPVGDTLTPTVPTTLVPTIAPTSQPVLTYAPDTPVPPPPPVLTAAPPTPVPLTECATFTCDNSTTCIINQSQKPECVPRGGCLPNGELCPVGTFCSESLRCECDPIIKADCELHGLICNPNEGLQNTCVEDKCRQFEWPPSGAKFCSLDSDCPSGKSCTGCIQNCVCDQLSGDEACDNSCRQVCENDLYPCPTDGSQLQNATWCCLHKQIGCSDYNCLEGTVSSWYQGKKDYCCQKTGRGCFTEINCYDPMLEWTYNEIDYCCGQKNVYCPIPPYNCTDEAAAPTWDFSKKLYCCSQGVGCDKYKCQWDGTTEEPWTESQKEWCCKNQGERCKAQESKSCMTLGTCTYDCQATAAERSNWIPAQRAYCCLQFGIACQLDDVVADCSASPNPSWTVEQQSHCCFEHDIGCELNCLSSSLSVDQKAWCCSKKGLWCPSLKLSLPDRYYSLKYKSTWTSASKNPKKLIRQLLTSMYVSSQTLRDGSQKDGVTTNIYYVGTLKPGGVLPADGEENIWGFTVDPLWQIKPTIATRRSVQTLNEYVQQTYAAEDDIRVLFNVSGGTETERTQVITDLTAALQDPVSPSMSNNEGYSVILLNGSLVEISNISPSPDTLSPTSSPATAAPAGPPSDDSFPIWAIFVILGVVVCVFVGIVVYKKKMGDDDDEPNPEMSMAFAGVYNDVENNKEKDADDMPSISSSDDDIL
eukprot:TRINITY_DN7725_c4_g1_i1.p1 TRINITY_DN7725_c4_g1~~TRINITY_DN7725_c4_g1_i1.p1  ORF type:complete len:1060 (+),score=182.66 TRINITY_DN7725_c4_g1_i1:38-3181(+)